MKNAFINLLGLNPQNLPIEVFVVCLLAWLLVLGATLWSIYGREHRSMVVKVIWTVVVVGVPFLGVLLYALFCLTQVESIFLQSATPSKKKPNPGTTPEAEYADAVV